jgi:hypothetical protein
MNDWTTRVEKDATPPDAVRARVVDGLRRGVRPWMQAAAALALFAAGWGVGASGSEPPPSQPRYMLLLFGETSAPADIPARAAEYGAWAHAVRKRGGYATGARLERARVRVGPAGPGDSSASWADAPLGGYFIVGATSIDEARALAEAHPHVRHGGTIVLRPLAGS